MRTAQLSPKRSAYPSRSRTLMPTKAYRARRALCGESTRRAAVSLTVAAVVLLGLASAVNAPAALEEGEPMAEQTVGSGARLASALPSAGELASPSSSALSEREATARGPRSESASVRAIRTVFGENARAVKVARCESRLNARAVSATNDWGLYQLNRPTWDPARNPRARPYWPRGKDWRHVFDPLVNARVAYAISRRGTDFWTHWRWSAGCWA